jgi:hypothetical protein
MLRGLNLLQIKNPQLRKVLVVAQFTITVALFISTAVAVEQMRFIMQSQEGYDRSQIFSLSLPSGRRASTYPGGKFALLHALKQELLRDPSVEHIAAANDAIMNLRVSMGGVVNWPGKKSDFQPMVTPLAVDSDFRRVFQLSLTRGRWFRSEGPADLHQFILNETAISEFGLDQQPLGQSFSFLGDSGLVIGVVRDFHFHSFRDKIGPVVLVNNPDWISTLFVQAPVSQMSRVLASAAKTWKGFFPGIPFEYHFFDDEFAQLYHSDIRKSWLIGLFAAVAVIISCLGLYGLCLFASGQRTKEMSIRKVLGATLVQVSVILSEEFALLVLVGILMGLPLGWWAIQQWLRDFAYRVHPGVSIFALAAGLAFGLAMVVVASQAIRTALVNPANALRRE